MRVYLFIGGLLVALLACPSMMPADDTEDQTTPPPTPTATATPVAKATPRPQNAATTGIRWQPSIAAALAKAKSTGKPIMIDFYADWARPCHMLDRQTWADRRIIGEAQKWVAVKVDTEQHPTTAKRWGITGLPTVLFVTPESTCVARVVGFQPPQRMRRSMEYALKKFRQQ